MKILFCTNQLSVHGGIERILSQKINYLLNDGYEVFLTTFEQSNKPDVYSLDSKLSRFDLAINYHTNRSYFHPKNLLKIVKHYFSLRSLIKKIKPDIVVSVSYTPEQFFLPYISTTIPKIKELHSSGVVVGISRGETKKSLKSKLTHLFKKYDALVLLNKDETPYFQGCNTVVIPNFTDFESDLPKNDVREKTVIAAGRIAPVKQFHELVYIWKIVHEDFPDWKFKLFGDGDLELRAELENLIQSLHLESSFFLMPSVSNLQEEMLNASLYVMTSATECFPMVLLEAQVCGLPIVSYDCPNGPRNIVSNVLNGYLVRQNDRIAFANKLSELMRDDVLRSHFEKNAKEQVVHFSKEKVMLQWNNLFSQLKNKN